jgi:hypothetical protein
VLGTPINYVVYTVQVRNNSRHDIIKASGTLYYNNANGEGIDFDDFSLDTPVAAGETITHTYQFVDKDIVPTRRMLKEIPIKEMRLDFEPNFVTYAEGMGQEIVYSK